MRTFDPDDSIKEFLKNHDVMENSLRVYKYTINYFFRWMVQTGRDATRPTRPDLLQYKAQLKKTKKHNTVGLYIASVKSYFSFLASVGLYDNIGMGIKTISKKLDFEKDPLSIDQIKILLSLPKKSIIDYRDHLILSLMYHNGLRIIEVSRLRYRDINLSNQEIWIQGKGSDVTECIAVNGSVITAIEEYTQAKVDHDIPVDDDQFLVSSHSKINTDGKPMRPDTISKIIGERLKQAGLKTPRITGHSLRHTAAVHMIIHGNYDLFAVQLFLRHKDSNVTRLYTRYAEKIKMKNNQPTNFLEGCLTTTSPSATPNKNLIKCI